MPDLDQMHSSINAALLDKAINEMNRTRAAETNPGITENAKQSHRVAAIQAMQTAINYLRGDVLICSSADAKKAQELEEKEPQFIAVAEEAEKLRKENKTLITKLGKLEASGKKGGARPAKKKSSPKKKAAKKKTAPAKKKSKRDPKKPYICDKCGKKFKAGAGLGKHRKTCKG